MDENKVKTKIMKKPHRTIELDYVEPNLEPRWNEPEIYILTRSHKKTQHNYENWAGLDGEAFTEEDYFDLAYGMVSWKEV